MPMSFPIGRYCPGDSPIHRLDPRSKLILTIYAIAVVFSARGAIGYGLLFAAAVGAILLSRVGFRAILRSLRPVMMIVGLTFALNAFLPQGGEAIWSWRFLTLTREGLTAALTLSARFALLVLTTQLLTLTTSPIALTDGMERLMRPLARLRFPAHELAMMMSIALRMIPTLMEETDKIKKAQMARGADFGSGNLFRRARAFIPLLVPLFVSAFRRAEELALAMEARCYRGGEGRTRMKVLRFARIDLYAALCALPLIAAAFV